jgi:signal transduction histidine kinase
MLTGHLEVALMSTQVNQEAKKIFISLLEDIKQLNKLSNGLLDLAQASLDISDLKLEQIRIDELIGIAQAEIVKRNKNYQVFLNFTEYPDNEDWLVLLANEQLLKSAFANIIENACKYSYNNTANIDFSFNEKNINITVSDNGIGISDADLKHVFEPFFRSNNVKDYSGHGIGLTLTQKIIQLHKGTIKIKSTLNNGTNVILSIPHI